MIKYRKIEIKEQKAWVELSTFVAGDVTEHHAMIHVSPEGDSFPQSLERLLKGYSQLQEELPKSRTVMCRFLLSDIANQEETVRRMLPDYGLSEGAVSTVGQPPLDGSKVALWVYLQEGTEVISQDARTLTQHNGVEYSWTAGWNSRLEGSYNQTNDILHRYEKELSDKGCSIEENCLRTWFFVRDVDTHYHGMVVARRENFDEHGLCSDTHYIASTGIGGQPNDIKSLVQMATYSAKGLKREQVEYLYAKDHLSSTYDYGVTFERGTKVLYGDRSHLIISGTASINDKGEVLHKGDVLAQADRMVENVQALLNEGGGDLSDIMQAIVYLRDISDYPVIKDYFASHFPNLPYTITLAPVCRPEWLIEMECWAVKENNVPRFTDF